MGKLRFVALSLAIAACGSDDRNGPADASIDAKVITPDAKVFMDAPPPTYDLACYGATPGTTVGDPIVVSGTAGAVTQNGTVNGMQGITVDFFKVNANTSAKTVTSGAAGAYTSGDLTGAVAIDHLRGSLASYRTTYLYPPQPIRMTLPADIPLPLVSQSNFELILGFAGADQDDTMYGALLVTVTDCNIADPQLIDGAELHVQQNGQDVGDIKDVGSLLGGGGGTFFVLNVPDGDVEVWATYDGKTFPKRTVASHKQTNGQTPVGSLTVTVVPPGPVY